MLVSKQFLKVYQISKESEAQRGGPWKICQKSVDLTGNDPEVELKNAKKMYWCCI